MKRAGVPAKSRPLFCEYRDTARSGAIRSGSTLNSFPSSRLPADGAAREVVRRHVDRTEFLDLDDPGIVADIDNPEDTARYRSSHMKIGPGMVFKGAGAAAVVWLVVGLGAPYVNANPYADRLRASLSRALGRQVEFRQAVKFSLFNGPGFSAEDVVIHEDPSIG